MVKYSVRYALQYWVGFYLILEIHESHYNTVYFIDRLYYRLQVAAWRSGNIVGCMNEVTLRRARLVLGCMSVFDG